MTFRRGETVRVDVGRVAVDVPNSEYWHCSNQRCGRQEFSAREVQRQHQRAKRRLLRSDGERR